MRGTLALVIAGFAAVLIWQWQRWPPPLIIPNSATGAEIMPPVPESPPQVQMPPPPEPERYAGILERPLFRPDRKPEPPPDALPEPAAAPEVNADLETLDLTAVMLTSTLMSAWVRDPAQPTLRRLRLGDDVHGWTVQKILEDQVILARAGEEHALILRDYSQSPPPSPAAAPASPKTANPPPAAAPPPTRRQLPRPPSPPPATGR